MRAVFVLLMELVDVVETIINHPPVITIGLVSTIPSHGWFMTLFKAGHQNPRSEPLSSTRQPAVPQLLATALAPDRPAAGGLLEALRELGRWGSWGWYDALFIIDYYLCLYMFTYVFTYVYI